MVRTRIWNEITKSKHDVEYIMVYSRFQSNLSKWMNILILVFSSSGILGWQIWEKPEMAAIACGLTAGVTLIKMISPFFILSDKETKKLDKYYIQLVNHFDRLEKFWYQSEESSDNQTKLTDDFYKLVNEGNTIHDRFNDINIMHLSSLVKKADFNSREYFKNIFNV